MENVFRIAALAVCAGFLSLGLKKQAPEFALLVTISAGALLLTLLLSELSAVSALADLIRDSLSGADSILGAMGKAAGICLITHLAAQTCLDCEQKSLAAAVELAGTAACLSAALPLCTQLFAGIGALL